MIINLKRQVNLWLQLSAKEGRNDIILKIVTEI